MKYKNKVFTTGEVAELCGVTLRTVVNWINKGKLPAYKLPGTRGDNRIRAPELISFMQENGIPLPEILNPATQDKIQTPDIDILIIDDERAMAGAISRILEREGYKVARAHDGFEGGIMFNQHQPKAVTLDLQMPRMDGFAVLSQLKSASNTKVIVISGSNETALNKARSLGADAVIKKPFENTELIQTVNEILSDLFP